MALCGQAWPSIPIRATEKFMARLKTDTRLFVNREIFNQFTAAREVEFEEKVAAIKASSR